MLILLCVGIREGVGFGWGFRKNYIIFVVKLLKINIGFLLYFFKYNYYFEFMFYGKNIICVCVLLFSR